MGKVSDIAKERNWDSDFGMKVINEHETIHVSQIRVNDTYQRAIEPGRLRKITKSIKTSGYWPAEVIILNEKLEAVDGNHRVNAARKLGIKRVPCSIVTFPSKKEEIRFFSHKNNWNTSLKPADAWHAKYKAGHPLANLLYALDQDPLSLLFNRVAVKGKENRKTKFSVTESLIFINTGAFGDYTQWTSQRDAAMTRKSIEIKYETIRDRVNNILHFFFAIFGKDKRENSLPYVGESVRAFCRFYSALNSNGLLDASRDIKSTIIKMRKFVFDSGFVKADRVGKFMYFATFYNRGIGEGSPRRLTINM